MTLPVQVVVLAVDESGAASVFDSAQVVLAKEDLIGDQRWPFTTLLPTHFHTDGHYVNLSGDPENEPKSGRWLLVVRARGFSTVVQKLTFLEAGSVVRAQSGWEKRGAGETAATVSIINFGEARTEKDAEQPRTSVLTVTLYPTRTLVTLSSNATDANFVTFAHGRRDRSFEHGKLNPGSIVYHLNARTNTTQVVVKDLTKNVSGWLQVAELPSEVDASTLGILDFYHRLDVLGRQEPGTVTEAAYFGHGWHAGPVVRNTSDDVADLIARSPTDYDGRPKDWHPDGVIAQRFPALPDAFRTDGVLFMAGCSHMSNVVLEMRAATDALKKGSPRDAFYRATVKGGWLHTTLDYTKKSIGQFMVSEQYGRYDIQGSASGLVSYNGLAARRLKADVWGASPASEANYGKIAGSGGRQHATMKVVNEAFFVNGKLAGGIENGHVLRYYQAEFAEDFVRDELGYTNNTRLGKAALPDPGWSTLRHMVYTDWELGPVLKLPSGLIVKAADSKSAGKFAFPIPHEDPDGRGHMYVVSDVTPNHLQERPTRRRAFNVSSSPRRKSARNSACSSPRRAS